MPTILAGSALMSQRRGVLLILIASCLLAGWPAPVGEAAPPQPAPTAVIAGLGQPSTRPSPYRSEALPYWISTRWAGRRAAHPGDATSYFDQFAGPVPRTFMIDSLLDSNNTPAQDVQGAFQAGMTARGYVVRTMARVRLLGHSVPVLAFADEDGAYATLLFTTPGRWWAMTLFSTPAAIGKDLLELECAARTFHLVP